MQLYSRPLNLAAEKRPGGSSSSQQPDMLCAKPPFFPGFGLRDLGRRARKDPERNPPEHAWEWEPGGSVSRCEDQGEAEGRGCAMTPPSLGPAPSRVAREIR